MRTLLEAIRQPVSSEIRAASRARREALPEHLRTPQQMIGVAHHSCGATHGVMERCDLACTSCYLSAGANAMPPMEEAEVRRQLDQLREFLGPQGKAQLTSGEVTLLPREQLGSYVRYAREIGLDPMVMTHGRRFLEEPDYLVDLVEKDGLEKISIHIDATQRGREEWSPDCREVDLMALRDRYAELIRDVRRRTGRRLHAAHTVTVTPRTVEEVPAIIAWVARNADAFRMVSFQPVAPVGRTQDESSDELELGRIWQRICGGLGAQINRDAMHFGHPECNIVVPVVVVGAGEDQWTFETVRADNRWDRGYSTRLFERLGGFSVRGRGRLATGLAALSLAARHPIFLLESLLYAGYRAGGHRREIARSLTAGLRHRSLQIRPLAIVVHRFMSPAEIETPLGQERLAACTFQVPVDGRMMPMCELNATELRARLYDPPRSTVTPTAPASGDELRTGVG